MEKTFERQVISHDADSRVFDLVEMSGQVANNLGGLES
jgi:hypothetical protein